MEFFLSGEIDVLAHDAWLGARGPVEDRLNAALRTREYGPAVHKIALIPMINRPEWPAFRKERRFFKRSERWADYRTSIDFRSFMEGDAHSRECLIVANLVDAVRDIGRKAGAGFSAERLIADILTTLDLSPADIVRVAEREDAS